MKLAITLTTLAVFTVVVFAHRILTHEIDHE